MKTTSYRRLLITWILCCVAMLLKENLYAVGGVADTSIVTAPILEAITSSKAMVDKVWQTLMHTQTVTMAKTLYDNYYQSMKYYNMVNEMSRHQGGFLGYLKDYSLEQAKRVARDEKEMIMNLQHGSNDTYVQRLVEGKSKALTEKMKWKDKSYDKFEDYTIKSIEDAEKRDNEIAQTIHAANKPMKSNTLEETKVKLQVHQIQLAQSIEHQNRAILIELLRQRKEQLDREKEQAVANIAHQQTIEILYNKLAEVVGKSKNPYQALGELPR